MPGSILIFPDLRTRNAYIRVIKETTGITPVGIGNTPAAMRAYYPDTNVQVIVHTASAEMQTKLGRHRVADPVDVDNPTESAKIAKRILNDLGYEATVNNHAEREFDEGFMAFVSVPAFDGIILLFWPKHPDPESVAKFRASGVFRAWTDADLANE